ncbi:MAG: hypothetical protein HYY20_12950 [Candidatus Tectomicrobia bacterium]|uniref:Uncharacterized protein n=1 Tax=Tectimicrobiota bacterium TaxID=2528274 RepID=A0A932CQN2_UNCTE|nr:hypothetical protein [Candidatus Tectomicrobia bacterium]
MLLYRPSPFASPAPGLRLKEGAPPILRPTKEEVAVFLEEARRLLDRNWAAQAALLGAGPYSLKWLEGKHFLLAGATGPGLGCALATAALNLLGEGGSLTVIARDLTRSVGYETGVAMQQRAEAAGLGSRFHWLNDGLALEGEGLEKIVSTLQEAGADQVVYINTVAAASSGLLPGYPPVFVKDVDEEGLFQWQLTPLSERSIEATKFIMGTMAVQFPHELERAGIRVAATAFADWRGSLDRCSRDPDAAEYGRQGAYSTSLHLPKEVLQEATALAYGSGRVVLDLFLPIMRTRALAFIPGGTAMSYIYDQLMKREGIRRVEIPELALAMLDRIGKALDRTDDNPFPRLDAHEASLDLWFYEVVSRLNDDENSAFYFRRWIEGR